MSGEDEQLLVREGLGTCIWPMEIDYAEQKVLWANTCEKTLLSLSIGDSDQSVTRIGIDSPLDSMSSMALFEDILLWNEGRVVKATNRSVDWGEVVTIYSVRPDREVLSVAVEVVHPKKQPAGSLTQDFSCYNKKRIGSTKLIEDICSELSVALSS